MDMQIMNPKNTKRTKTIFSRKEFPWMMPVSFPSASLPVSDQLLSELDELRELRELERDEELSEMDDGEDKELK
jgi:hypothetical protein